MYAARRGSLDRATVARDVIVLTPSFLLKRTLGFGSFSTVTISSSGTGETRKNLGAAYEVVSLTLQCFICKVQLSCTSECCMCCDRFRRIHDFSRVPTYFALVSAGFYELYGH